MLVLGFRKELDFNMKIMRICYNQTKRKRVQILLSIYFLFAFAVCLYLALQKPRKTVIHVEDVNPISKQKSNEIFQDFEEIKKRNTYLGSREETFTNDVEAIKSHASGQIVQNEDNVFKHEKNVFRNEKFTKVQESSSIKSHERKLENQAEDITNSLRGFLNHHLWDQVCSYQVESLREFILFPQAPSKRRTLSFSSFVPAENENNFGERVFGLISPKTSGEYQFAISSSWNSELWLSSDETSENLRKIASLGSSNDPGGCQPRNFSNSPSQISSTIFLTKNVRYFIDILHKHKSGKAHLHVAWRLLGEVKFSVIASEFLWTKLNDSNVTDNAVRLADYEEQPQQSRDVIPPFVDSMYLTEVLSSCPYKPSYLVKHHLIRFQGARNKSNTHFAAVYPPDTTNNSLPLMKNEDIWWWENAVGNAVTHPILAKDVVRVYMEALEAKFPHVYELKDIVSVEYVPDPQKGDRFLLELLLTDNRTGGRVLLTEHVFRSLEESKLCYPEGFRWTKHATVNIIVPVRNAGRWALYFIRNIAEITRQTQDFDVHVIIVDYESNDIDIEAVLSKSSIKRYTVVRIPREESFNRAVALQRGAEAVMDPHSILFLCDLHLKIPPNLISTIRKHCVEGKMAFSPVVKRLRCGYYPDLPFGYWETLGFGLLAIFKSDFDHVGGMNIREFTGWGGEDWELLDRVLMSGLEVERLKIPDFYHFFHPSLSGKNQRVGA